MLDVLSTLGEASASTLARQLPVSRQAVVKHLGALERAELVTSRRHGKEVLFAVRPEALSTTADWMTSLADRWERRLMAIKRIAEEASR